MSPAYPGNKMSIRAGTPFRLANLESVQEFDHEEPQTQFLRTRTAVDYNLTLQEF